MSWHLCGVKYLDTVVSFFLDYPPRLSEQMAHLFNRNVLLGVSGGIAAYKSAELIRELQERGAQVRVIMTHGAQEFITPLTLQALSGNPVHTQLLDERAELGMGHIELARWADLLLIAPATADLIARLSAGRADDLLSTVALATPAPLMLAPAMNQQMWKDQATTANIDTLLQRGAVIVGPAAGVQACGDVGPGRMEEPSAIADAAASLFATGELAGKRVVITAGPTREALDPVRYISNNSSGKMGYALAQAAVDAGAITTVVSGPVNLPAPDHTRMLAVQSAEEMLEQCLTLLPECDIFIACAAVADYRPASVDSQKIKKGPQEISLQLVRTPDIVAAVAAHEHRPFTVGFAAETNDVLTYAREKMKRKGLDMIVANDVADPTIGFNSDDNAVTVLWRDGQQTLERASKGAIARQIVNLIAQQA
jgi:phosphopantothenoylcysteine decarboxylase / phosphopantothenate---cysteine ligase